MFCQIKQHPLTDHKSFSSQMWNYICHHR